MVYLAVRPAKEQERKSWMGVYSFKKEKEAWSFLATLRHTRRDNPEYEEPCSYRLFEENQECEAKTWAGVEEITGQNWTKQQNITDIISATHPRSQRDLGFNARKEADRMRRESNRNVEKITGQPRWNRHKELREGAIPLSTGERLNLILNFFIRKGIGLASITFRDGSTTNVVFDDIWYITQSKFEYNGVVYEGSNFDDLFERAQKDVPIEDLTGIIIGMAEKLPKDNLDAIDNMIFFPQFGLIRPVRTKGSEKTIYRAVETADTPLQYSILKNANDISTIAPNNLKFAITDKGILKRLADKEEFGV